MFGVLQVGDIIDAISITNVLLAILIGAAFTAAVKSHHAEAAVKTMERTSQSRVTTVDNQLETIQREVGDIKATLRSMTAIEGMRASIQELELALSRMEGHSVTDVGSTIIHGSLISGDEDGDDARKILRDRNDGSDGTDFLGFVQDAKVPLFGTVPEPAFVPTDLTNESLVEILGGLETRVESLRESAEHGELLRE